MSDGRPRDDGRHGGPDQPPMLVLGEERPEVEDTTAEELARQRAELDRQRRELEAQDRERRLAAKAEAERRRREAEERLAEERRLAEVELARRQRLLDDAERRLQKTERRLRRRAQEAGTSVPDVPRIVADGHGRSTRRRTGQNSLLAAAERRSGAPVPRMGRAIALALVGGALVLAGSLASVDRPSPGQVDDFVAADQSRVRWLEAGLALDEEVARYLAGEDVTGDDGRVGSVTLAQEAAGTSTDDYSLQDFEETTGPLLAEPGSTPQRVLSAWDDTRSAAGYAVPRYEVQEAGELLEGDRVLATWLLLGGAVAVGGLAYGLARGGTRVGAGLAGLALVPTALLVAGTGDPVDVTPALEAHTAALEDAQDVYDQVGRDLQVVLGTRALQSYERDVFWEGAGYLDDERHDAGALTAYVDAREDLRDVDIRSLSTEEAVPHARALVDAGTALLATETASLEQARAAAVAGAGDLSGRGRHVTLTSAAVLLPLAALLPAVLRRREVES